MQSCRFYSIFKLGWTACKRVAPALFDRRSDAIWGRSFAAEPHGMITISTFCPCICAYRPDHHLCSIWCASACLRQAAKAGHAPAVHLLAVLKSSKQASSSFTWKQTRTMRVYTQASKSPHAQQQQATSLPWPRTSRWRRPEVQDDVFTVLPPIVNPLPFHRLNSVSSDSSCVSFVILCSTQ